MIFLADEHEMEKFLTSVKIPGECSRFINQLQWVLLSRLVVYYCPHV